MDYRWKRKTVLCKKRNYLTKEICKARAAVCGLGQFIFIINGQKVGDHELDPGWTNYKKRIQYVTFDVTDDLKKGKCDRSGSRKRLVSDAERALQFPFSTFYAAKSESV